MIGTTSTSHTTSASTPSPHRTHMRVLGTAMAAAVVGGGIVATSASAETRPVESANASSTSALTSLPAPMPTPQLAGGDNVVQPRAARSATPITTARVPKGAAKPAPGTKLRAAASRGAVRHPPKGSVAYSQWYAKTTMASTYGWGSDQHACLVTMWTKESEWKTNSDDHDNGYTWGIPQARPGSKMSSAGPDWRTNPETQIRWGLGYIRSTYGSPCHAWSFWQDHRWY